MSLPTANDEEKNQYNVSVLSSNEFEHDLNPVISTVVSLDGKKIDIHRDDADVAMNYIDQVVDLELDPAYEKKLVRKIDWALLPIIVALMSCQLMDKTTNSYASIMGLQTSLNMSASEYSWVGSSFYFGYMVFQYPANRMMQRWPLSKTLSSAIIIWGIILMCHAACSNSAGFLVCRVLLGVFEGFMTPAYILLTAQWWRKSEQFMRSSIWWGFQGFGTLLGAGIAYGLNVNRSGYHAFASWRLLYIITGIITIFLGIVSMVHVPDTPVKAWFLNDKEKAYCVERAKENQSGYGNQKFKWDQFKETVLDPCPYIFFFYGMSYAIPNGGFTNFGSLLLKGDFGFKTNQALLMNMPGGGIDIVAPPIVAWLTTKYFNNKRIIPCILVQLVVVVGMCLFNFTDHKGSKLAGYLSFYIATCVSAGMASIIASNTSGTTKKIVTNIFYFVGYCAGNIIGPQTFRANQAPGYTGAKVAMLVSFIAGAILLGLLYIIYRSRNMKKDKQREQLGEKYVVPENIAFADLTDIQNPEFRYSL